jgi:hypothetical protein
MPLPNVTRRLLLFAAFGVLTQAAVGMVLDQGSVGISVDAGCGILFGYFAAQ